MSTAREWWRFFFGKPKRARTSLGALILLYAWLTGQLSGLLFGVALLCYMAMILRGMATGSFKAKKKKS